LALDGASPQEIGARLGIAEYEYEDSYEIRRKRPNAVEKAIARGNKILAERAKIRQESELIKQEAEDLRSEEYHRRLNERDKARNLAPEIGNK
jgi:methylthioribose-1-phosphate isomerase